MTSRSLERVVFFGIPALVVAVSYAALCLRAGTPWPWGHTVHEDGSRTLLGTVFYFEHALRELPLDLLLGLGAAGAVRWFTPRRDRVRGRRVGLGALVLLCLVVVVGAIAVAGVPEALRNLAQMHTRPGAELAWGAHWRYHLLSRLALLALALAVAGLAAARRSRGFTANGDPRLFRRVLIAFALITVVFLPNLDPLLDSVFLGHQARELATHTLVTLPLALGAALAASGAAPRGGGERSSRPAILLAAAGAAAAAAYLAAGVLLTGASSQGQTDDLTVLLGAHVFEHSFGYLIAPLAAWLACATRAGPVGESSNSSSSIIEGS